MSLRQGALTPPRHGRAWPDHRRLAALMQRSCGRRGRVSVSEVEANTIEARHDKEDVRVSIMKAHQPAEQDWTGGKPGVTTGERNEGEERR